MSTTAGLLILPVAAFSPSNAFATTKNLPTVPARAASTAFSCWALRSLSTCTFSSNGPTIWPPCHDRYAGRADLGHCRYDGGKELAFPIGYLTLMVPLPFCRPRPLPLALFTGYCSGSIVSSSAWISPSWATPSRYPMPTWLWAQCSGVNSLILNCWRAGAGCLPVEGPVWSRWHWCCWRSRWRSSATSSAATLPLRRLSWGADAAFTTTTIIPASSSLWPSCCSSCRSRVKIWLAAGGSNLMANRTTWGVRSRWFVVGDRPDCGLLPVVGAGPGQRTQPSPPATSSFTSPTSTSGSARCANGRAGDVTLSTWDTTST